ncbi:T9SS type A sorting domain-containing protein [Pedobacter montanisoli]|uniref:T9SS type A sorting domain-containing protein n=1 Tax=Pedobacter montanisoli TaxID=2923277 RepID=A0ABS9ZX37_9SPHI|nr:T9SS type A sorting domain-containing protein [Pedobacter montanisoli]MCJ0742859.1 T9SS type A sorting domain-containing protein [Pedobacter montanisoli]
MRNYLKIALKNKVIYLSVLLMSFAFAVFAQKVDSSSIKSGFKNFIPKTPQIKANITPYKPKAYMGALSAAKETNITAASNSKSGKTLTVLKIYPNPVVDQLNVNLRLDREVNLSIKITDLLGNDVVTLANEKAPHGEQTKTYTLPNKLNPGIYFLKIIAGGEPVIKRISVL